MKFARRMDHCEVSGIRKIFDLVQDMKDCIDLSLGQPHFDVPAAVKKAATQAIEEGFNKYTVTQGIPELHAALRASLEKRLGKKVDGLLITGGAAGGLFLSMMALVDDGDEVIVPDPYFVLYKHMPHVAGGTVKFIDTYPDFKLKPEQLEQAITPKTKLLLFNNPGNPTGAAYTREEVKAIADVARRHNLFVIADEIYETYSHDFPHQSMMSFYENTLLVSGFSKTYGMPGWRMGYAAGPTALIDKMLTLQQYSFVCPPAPFQKAIVQALSEDMGPTMAEYRKKRDYVYGELKGSFDVIKPQGAFYIFPKVPWGTDQDFVKKAIENKVLIVPGSACSHRNTHFRISYATSESNLEKGVAVLKKIARR